MNYYSYGELMVSVRAQECQINDKVETMRVRMLGKNLLLCNLKLVKR